MTLRELKYVILGEDKLSDKMNRISGASDKATRSLGDHTTKLNGLKNKFTEAAGTIPVFGSAMGNAGGLMTGMAAGAAIAGAAVVGLGLAFRKGIAEASNFELEFRKLENINLDKSKKQIDELRDRILSISGAGYDPNVISQGYFDIQSLTGKSGAITEYIVKNQAEFARATGADINNLISGTGAAMRNFGFGPEQLDAYNKSMMGTVATAKITYDELAGVSSMYAGTANAAHQSVSSANKLMALFTTQSNIKSPEEAATKTKTAFQDLFKKSTRDSFKAIGIDLYDIKNNGKQIDQIMLEVNKKFASKTSAKAMDELRNKFAGNEGITALLNAAMMDTGKLLQFFKDFDKGGDGLEKMLKRSREDINNINNDINGKLKTSWVKLGESVLPAWIEIKKVISSALDMITGTDTPGITAADVKKNYGVKNEKEWLALQKQYSSKIQAAQAMITGATDGSNKYGLGAVSIAEARIKTLHSLSADLTANYGVWNKPPESNGNTDTLPPPDPSIKNGINSISGGGVRNVTVHFDKLVETFNVNTTNLTDSSGKIKTDIEAIIVRAIAGSEQILGAN